MNDMVTRNRKPITDIQKIKTKKHKNSTKGVMKSQEKKRRLEQRTTKTTKKQTNIKTEKEENL